MMEQSGDIAVIGGGPAGIAAAATAARTGASVILLDEADTLGGHFYKQYPADFEGRYFHHDQTMVQEFQSRRAELFSGPAAVIHQARVWGIFKEPGPGFQVYAEHPADDTVCISARAVILAPGVYDRPLPFPGWELPGVITPGAVQMALKKQALLPGSKVLVCGSGPLQLVVAGSLVQEGAEVVAVLDTCGLLDGMRDLPGALPSLTSRLGEIFDSILLLVRRRVPIYSHRAVFRALGRPGTGVEGAVIGKVSPDGHPLPGSERTLEVDTICTAFGFIPSLALTLHLGCSHRYDPRLGAYFPTHDESMRSSAAGVFLAGDLTGVGGKALAGLQGQIAGISAAEQLEFLSPEAANRERRRLEGPARREQRFARWLWNRYRLRPGLLDLATDETLLCRCENVTVGDLRQSLDQGARDLYGAKLRTRVGMGSCQGQYCMQNAALLIARQTGAAVTDTGLPSIRPPLSPVRLKKIAAG